MTFSNDAREILYNVPENDENLVYVDKLIFTRKI